MSSMSEELNERNADDLEEEYVHKVYDSIASHFSNTRYKPWPKVSQFLTSLPIGSLVLDIGCGNGKYLNVNPNVVMIGSDRSEPLLKICKKKKTEAVLCDCLQLCFRHSFDACICVAVLHHLSSERRRLMALQSMVDLLTIGGKALVYVWALEQQRNGKCSPYVKKTSSEQNHRLVQIDDNHSLCVHQNGTQFESQEVLIPWTTISGQKLRYYHVFKGGELESMVGQVPNARLLNSYYDSGNWAAIIERV